MRNKIPGGKTKLERTKEENKQLELALASAYRIITVLVDRSPQPVRIDNYETIAVEGFKLNRSNGRGFFQFTVTRTPSPTTPAESPSDTGLESAIEALTEEQSEETGQAQ